MWSTAFTRSVTRRKQDSPSKTAGPDPTPINRRSKPVLTSVLGMMNLIICKALGLVSIKSWRMRFGFGRWTERGKKVKMKISHGMGKLESEQEIRKQKRRRLSTKLSGLEGNGNPHRFFATAPRCGQNRAWRQSSHASLHCTAWCLLAFTTPSIYHTNTPSIWPSLFTFPHHFSSWDELKIFLLK